MRRKEVPVAHRTEKRLHATHCSHHCSAAATAAPAFSLDGVAALDADYHRLCARVQVSWLALSPGRALTMAAAASAATVSATGAAVMVVAGDR